MFLRERHTIVQESVSEGIQWHFIPPRAPNFGGIWEASVRSFKTHFKRVVGTAILTIDEIHTGIPEPTLTEIQECRLTKLQRTEQMRQYLWNRWSKDYLNQLQQRTKWKTKGIDLKPGDMVLIREDNIPPLCWPMGRVMETHPGDDGAVRVVTLKTMRGLFKRPVNRLSLLPMEP
ncbi:PREDICTED: uncharacterized protein LOC108757559 [Trachymyrmex cornetzi]|uniref:uncharacterized protein LOC108757559 n=1 Tax=Trachymyrmex cornetzi TaxID=471704 RepID=UPI00084F5387|nr:PREDICTED: uncharacterized protein LOC108757559 [Trachymyrmex cornetzi]